jgi:hypothetical protein
VSFHLVANDLWIPGCSDNDMHMIRPAVDSKQFPATNAAGFANLPLHLLALFLVY